MYGFFFYDSLEVTLTQSRGEIFVYKVKSLRELEGVANLRDGGEGPQGNEVREKFRCPRIRGFICVY